MSSRRARSTGLLNHSASSDSSSNVTNVVEAPEGESTTAFSPTAEPDVSQAATATRPSGSSGNTAGAARAAATPRGDSYDPNAFITYAKKWTKTDTMNPVYPSFSNNCANFVSQSLNQAGWFRTGGVNPYKLSNWDYDLSGPAKQSHTWSVASKLYRYAYDTRRLTVLPNIWDAEPGDIYFVAWGNQNDKEIDHVVAVTGRTSQGVPRISSKTTNRHKILLTTWIAIINRTTGPRTTWYGLEDKVR